jgi:YfiH family protein
MTSVRPAAFAAAELFPGVFGGFTCRSGGVSSGRYASLNLGYSVGDDDDAVRANRERLIGSGPDRPFGPASPGSFGPASLGPRCVAWMHQVHGARVARVTGSEVPADPAGGPEADAIFTEVVGVGLGVLVADCAPVLVADPVAGLAGAAHAGRPGLALGVVPALIAAMTAAGADPGRMRALIGPSICGRCYEVPAALRDEVEAAAPGSACVSRKGTPGIDLRAGLHRQLDAAGVAAVSDDRRCPAESAELYSYRRDGVTGRFAGLVWLG